MDAVGSTIATDVLSEKQRVALISLLADEDPMVYEAVRARLLACGLSATEWLRPAQLSSDRLVRRRAKDIVHHLSREASHERFLACCLNRGGLLDLEAGVWLLAQTQYPGFNEAAYRALLDQYASELREKTDMTGHPGSIVEAINHYLFIHLGYTGNEAHYYDPDNSYLNRVMDTRMGNPISLCTIYLLVARRLQLPIVGIGLPGHFICRYQTAAVEFFVDPFHRGRLLTQADCRRFLLQAHTPVGQDWLAPVASRRMLLRMCANLRLIYRHHGRSEEAARFESYLEGLARE